MKLRLRLLEGASEGVRVLPIIMCGCALSRYGAKLNEQLPKLLRLFRQIKKMHCQRCCRRSEYPWSPQSIVAAYGMLRIIDGASEAAHENELRLAVPSCR